MNKTNTYINLCESKGGVKYELILSESPGKKIKKLSESSKKDVSLDEIEEKLQAAEERRLSQEHLKQQQRAQRLNHIIEVQKNKKYSIRNFQISVQKHHDKKMKICGSNREAYLRLIQDKSREVMERVKEIQNTTLYLKQNHFQVFCKRFEKGEKARQKQYLSLQEHLAEQDDKMDYIIKQLTRLQGML